MKRVLWGIWVACVVACAVACASPHVEQDQEPEQSPVDGGASIGLARGADAQSEASAVTGEICGNGLDDNGNGQIDEGCTCAEGAVQKCFVGPADQAGVGTCAFGQQTCVHGGSGEFQTAGWGTCVGSGNPEGGACVSPKGDGGVPCVGTGRIFKSAADDCVDDNGRTAPGDKLEIYCVNDIARFCLSNEACPWRSGQTTPDNVTCSRAGIPAADTYFAKARKACGSWNGNSRYCCSVDGVASFSGC